MKCLFLLVLIFCHFCAPCTSVETHFNFGKVKLENSGAPSAQPSFLQGLAALHSFEYKEAIIDFKKAQEIDPTFALAYWGEAMAYNQAFWRQQDLEAARAALNKLDPIAKERINKAKYPLEKDLLHSLDFLYGQGGKIERDDAYSNYMAKLYTKYPNNLEIISLYALSILGTVLPYEQNLHKNIMAAGVLDTALGFNPSQEMLKHPGILHYYIHALDNPLHAILALKSARLYANVAPDSEHALHMPSHIYLQLGLWDDVRTSNQLSYDASVRWVDQRSNDINDRGFHALYWLLYANLQLGRYTEARQNVAHIAELYKNHPICQLGGYWALMVARYMVATGDCIVPFSMPLLQNILRCPVSDEPQTYSFIYAQGYCAMRNKDYVNGSAVIDFLEMLRTNLKRELPYVDNLVDKDNEFRINILSISIQELLAIEEQSHGNATAALAHAQLAAEIESKTFLPHNGIPVPVQSAFELYGFLLLQDKQWEQAVRSFKKQLERLPNQAKAYLGLALAMEGLSNAVAAKEYALTALKIWSGSDQTFWELNQARRIAQN